jgi:hypothetical protein
MSQPHWARLRHCYVTADEHGRVPALLLEWLRTRTCGTQGSAAHHRVGLVDLGPQHHPRVGKPLCCHGRCDERKPRDDAQSAQSPRNCQRRSLTTVNGGRISAGQRRPSSVAGACRQRGDSCGSTTRPGSFVAPSCLRQVEPAELQHPLDHLVDLSPGEDQVGQLAPVPGDEDSRRGTDTCRARPRRAGRHDGGLLHFRHGQSRMVTESLWPSLDSYPGAAACDRRSLGGAQLGHTGGGMCPKQQQPMSKDPQVRSRFRASLCGPFSDF